MAAFRSKPALFFLAAGLLFVLLWIALLRPDDSQASSGSVFVNSGTLELTATPYSGSAMTLQMYSPAGDPSTVYIRTNDGVAGDGLSAVSGCQSVSDLPAPYNNSWFDLLPATASNIECSGVANIQIDLTNATPLNGGGTGSIHLMAPLPGSAPGSSSPRTTITPGANDLFAEFVPSNSVIQGGAGNSTILLGRYPGEYWMSDPQYLPTNVQVSGGGGNDSVNFSGSDGSNVNVSLDGVANDGFAGQGINVGNDFKNIMCDTCKVDASEATSAVSIQSWGAADSVITGSSFGDTIKTTAGTVNAGDGDDQITLGVDGCTGPMTATAHGGAGNDSLTEWIAPGSSFTWDPGTGTNPAPTVHSLTAFCRSG